ncbi:MAG: serine/threonine protein kinase [Prevotella sp.]|nr:serine/threonine protein kinase [Prevotella sp.]
MDFSQFTDSSQHFDSFEPINTHGATCDTYRVKLYGKLHFLKQLKPEYSNNIRYQEAFRKEFETGYRLEHPNLVRYISLTEDGILMEYVDGETLTQCLANHPEYFKDKNNSDKFLRQLLDVVGYLHSHQVLHLDLKPDNILLTRINNDVKLIDLGCCYTDSFQDTTGRTNTFAAPEQLQGGAVDERTDIYSVGKILELLPNHHIYNKVITRCTADNPEDRYQSVKDVTKALNGKSQQRHFLYALLPLLIVAAVVAYFLFSQGKGSHQEQPLVPVDTPSVGIVDSKSVAPVNTLPKEEDIQQKSNSSTSSTPPSKKTGIEQLKADISHAVRPKFNATLGALPDSVLPGTEAWAQAGYALEKSLENTLKDLILSHSDIPMEQVAQELNSYVQALITVKYNQAMKRQAE